MGPQNVVSEPLGRFDHATEAGDGWVLDGTSSCRPTA